MARAEVPVHRRLNAGQKLNVVRHVRHWRHSAMPRPTRLWGPSESSAWRLI